MRVAPDERKVFRFKLAHGSGCACLRDMNYVGGRPRISFQAEGSAAACLDSYVDVMKSVYFPNNVILHGDTNSASQYEGISGGIKFLLSTHYSEGKTEVVAHSNVCIMNQCA